MTDDHGHDHDHDTPLGADAIDEAFVPKPGEAVASVELDGEAVIYDERSGSIHLLNPTASVLWQCFDGSGDLGGLITDVSETFQIDRETAARDVLEVARNVGRLGLLDGIRPAPRDEIPAASTEDAPA